MKISVANHIRLAAKKGLKKEYSSDWKKVPEKERKVLKKYANMLLKKMPEEKFPEADKEILIKHAKGFIKFLNSL